MKKILALTAFLFASISSFCQTFPYFIGAPNSVVAYNEQVGQLLNLSNTNANETLDTVSTSSATGVLYLTTAKYSAVTRLPVIYPLIGYGILSFTISGLKISGTVPTTGTVTLQGCNDGVQFGPIHNGNPVNGDTLFMANIATTQTYTWDLGSKRFRYYRLVVNFPSSTQSSSWSGWYFLNKGALINGK